MKIIKYILTYLYVVIHLQSHCLIETFKKLLGHLADSKMNCGLLDNKDNIDYYSIYLILPIQVFHVVTLEALYTEQIQNLDLGLIIPQSNVATLDHSALVTEGVCRYKYQGCSYRGGLQVLISGVQLQRGSAGTNIRVYLQSGSAGSSSSE